MGRAFRCPPGKLPIRQVKSSYTMVFQDRSEDHTTLTE
jgi:hypothetical protein